MLIEKLAQAGRMLSTRTDDEMFFALKALSQQTNVDTSTLMRLAIATLLKKARSLEQPVSWDDLKRTIEEPQET
jgi:hypothetical protein